MIEANESEIAEWYSGKNIFITGASGFVGKVLLEKFLRSCPNIGDIYILIRTKKDQNPQERLFEMLKTPLFDKVRKENPNCYKKIIPIEGDISLPELGISNEDRAVLTKNVRIVFHSAATVKFDEALKLAVQLNVIGTKNVINLCYDIKNLESLVHVSTAYCNCDRKDIDEKVYPPPMSLEELSDYLQNYNDDELHAMTKQIIGNRPNTYAFTKAIAENVVVQHAGKLPIAIFRPSIVTGAWKEPMAGWVDNLNGPTGILIAAGKGILRTMVGNEKCIADIIPVDVVTNMLICVGWNIATTRPKNIPVYNCTSGSLNPIKWKSIKNHTVENFRETPVSGAFWYPVFTTTTWLFYYWICNLILHIVPAYFMDLYSVSCGKKPIMMKIQKRLHGASNVLKFFVCHEWNFKTNNVIALIDKMSQKDKEIFNFDVRSLNWRSYMKDYTNAMRTIMLKEDDSSLIAAKQRMRILKFLYYTSQIMFVLMLCRFTLNYSDAINKSFGSLSSVYTHISPYFSTHV